MIIYKITNNINNKIYVGQTTQKVSRRLRRHASGKEESVISRAIKKYGIEKFNIEELYYSFSLEDLNEKEKFFIKEMNTISPNGYNIRSGGDNKILCEDTKKLISHNTKKAMRNPNVRLKISKAKTGCIPWNKGVKTKIQTRNQKIMCIETGEVFKNQLEASKKFECSKSAVSKHIKYPNKLKKIKGITLKRI